MLAAAAALRDEASALAFGDPVTHVTNPLDYAWDLHERWVRTWGASPRRVLFLGMNPGPWGMAQTGVPFGEVAAVRDWLGLQGEVRRPAGEHPRRPVQGLDCSRSEVSGRRLWGLFAARFGTPERFFAEHFVLNYCPLVFMEQSGRNRTPDKLPAAERAPLFAACDRRLRTVVELYSPQWVVGVGGFARAKLAAVLDGTPGAPQVGTVLHPSPASPAANRGWDEAAVRQLREQTVW
ncbi:MAG: single-stranded DNA-binding protein [Candidatus Krumholzibacteriia bacterium]